MCHNEDTDIRVRKITIPILFDPQKEGDEELAYRQAQISKIEGSNISLKPRRRE